jgi:hypothetical protein
MKKSIILSACIIAICLNAKSYKAKVEPLETVTISSEVTGKVEYINKDVEFSNYNGKVISIDSKLDEIKLKNLRDKYSILKEQLKIKEDNYKSIKKIRAKGQIEKDKYKLDVLNIKATLNDIENSIETLKDTIDKKSINSNSLYIKEFLVSKNELVSLGTRLFIAEDQSSSKVIIYVDAEDIKNIQNKKILINGNENHNYKISKFSNSTDSTFISSYKVELVDNNSSSTFGQIVSIDIK